MKKNTSITKSKKTLAPFYDLVNIYARLRAPGGCPWDRVQTSQSLKPYLIEETYEVVDAIDENDPVKVQEELGDLLGQILFHAQMANEKKQFDIDDAIRTHAEKMKRRHPHIFGTAKVKDAKEVLLNWEQIKYQEKKKERSSALDGIPRHLPALLKAHRMQDKAARLGFDWEHIDQVFAKLDEEMQEFEQAYAKKDKRKIREELGDILFALVNLARYLEIDPEDALKGTINKFHQRFQHIEHSLQKKNQSFKDTTLAEMEELWDKAKVKRGKSRK
ncbi:MAG TPA: nucleoside triphosphate pyrophosphohydrolase [Candidatus Edwardsbacteria bacterium]|nr:nucleoside triphosphate pyrophosphohydrolase [Candidatus Edwardsbacteria bacterium]